MTLLNSDLNKNPLPDEDADLRCCCGRLLAVRVPGGYEIRCVRCKSVQVLPLAEEDGTRG